MKIDLNKLARTVEVDTRIPLRYYYRIADNLLRQANIYREEKNIVDLYIILLRYSSLLSDTIPNHRDYQTLLPTEKVKYRKRLLPVVEELEFLKPEFNRRVNELNKTNDQAQLLGNDEPNTSSSSKTMGWPPGRSSYSSTDINRLQPGISQPSRSSNSNLALSPHTIPLDQQFPRISLGLPLPKQETLSRHSILGPNGLNSQWLGPKTEIKVQYPSDIDFAAADKLGSGSATADSQGAGSTMDSVLSLDDGRWLRPTEDLSSAYVNQATEDLFQFVSIRQPTPPPVLAQVQRQEFAPICPSKVADPRPGPAKPSLDDKQSGDPYQHLHVPVRLMEDFLRLARGNTQKNLETCAVLAGSLKNKVFYITTLIVPKQESTSDSCQTLNEEEIFEIQDRLSLFPLGWIHTHPSQTCFMSSVDLHTHYSYQIMLPEAVAVVMAPTDTSSPHGIFHLSDPGGVSIIRNCQQRGFHPHEEPDDGSPIYEHCSHVFMNSRLKFEVVDLR